MRVWHHIHTYMNIPGYKPRREKSSSQSDCEGGQARRHVWIIQMSGYASLSVANNLRESMLETARRCHLSNSATALLRASFAVVLSLWPPRNGDPVETPVYVYIFMYMCIFSKTSLSSKSTLKTRAYISNKGLCMMHACMRACSCMHACVHACVYVCVHTCRNHTTYQKSAWVRAEWN